MAMVEPRRVDDERVIRRQEREVRVIGRGDLALPKETGEGGWSLRHPTRNIY